MLVLFAVTFLITKQGNEESFESGNVLVYNAWYHTCELCVYVLCSCVEVAFYRLPF